MRRAVFLDRDGILNRLVMRNGQAVSPRSLEQFELVPGIEQSIELLKRAGLLVVVVTNQPDVARMFLAASDLDHMHTRLREALPVDAIYACPHDERDSCACRKPKPGLLLQAASQWQICLEESWMVGDSWKDMEAGRAARCRTCLIRTPATDEKAAGGTLVASSLQEAVEAILADVSAARSQSEASSQ